MADIVNVSLTAVGLGFVGWQVWVARGAAQAASKAASEARKAMAQRVTSAGLEIVRGIVRGTLDDLHKGDTQSAWSDCQDARERLMEMRARPGLEDRQSDLTDAIAELAQAQDNLSGDQSDDSLQETVDTLQDVLQAVVELQQHALFFEREANAS